MTSRVARIARHLHGRTRRSTRRRALSNGGFSDYNALQLELRRQFRNGFFGQINYTLSNTKTDSSGTAQNRFEAFMDNLRPGLNTGRSVFHVTHVVSANAIYELPFGREKRWLNSQRSDRCHCRRLAGRDDLRLAERIADQHLLGPRHLQSGRPLQLHRPDQLQHRVDDAVESEIKNLLGIFKQPDGKIYWIDPKVIDATDRPRGGRRQPRATRRASTARCSSTRWRAASATCRSSPSTARRSSASTSRSRSASASPDRYRFEIKGEAFNLTNTPSFFRGDMDVNSTTFGRLTSVNVNSRVVQLSARFEF